MKKFTALLIAAFSLATIAEAQYCILPGRTSYSFAQPTPVIFVIYGPGLRQTYPASFHRCLRACYFFSLTIRLPGFAHSRN
jgi:hypothetical protein